MNQDEWRTWNQEQLMRAVDTIKRALLRRAGRDAPEPPIETEPTDGPPSALEIVCRAFGLTPFERGLLVLCAAYELSGEFPALCAAANGSPAQSFVCLSLALAALPDPHWSALSPAGALRRLRLIEIGSGPSLTLSPLRIDESVLHFLAGVPHLDDRIARLTQPAAASVLAPSHEQIARDVAAAWREAAQNRALPVIQILGGDEEDRRALAVAACGQIGRNGWEISTRALPLDAAERAALLALWEREATLHGGCLVLNVRSEDLRDEARGEAIVSWLERTRSPVAALCEERLPLRAAPPAFEVAMPDAAEQRALWRSALADAEPVLNGALEPLLGQFRLSAHAIDAACREAKREWRRTGQDLPTLLWEACRGRTRPRLDDLAQRITSRTGWDDLVLPPSQTQTLRDIAAHVRQRTTVYDRWGFADRGGRGLGLSVLFAGTSGTGKTLAAEVLANALGLDLYKIDLSSVVSKYIGETEKNLKRVFDAAEGGGAVLLFDEADALFGKRSEVKDSHDRHANIEVSYLLQRMELYRGLAILTTNLRASLDVAFLRRLRFIVEFPFPEAAERAEIWRRVFPTSVPVDGLNYDKLARLNVAGGSIWNTALNAAFLAADAQEPVRMTHLLRAARQEYAKLEKTLTGVEIEGWSAS